MTLRVEIHRLGLADDGGLLADISDIAMECTLKVRHNMPRSFEITDVPAGDSRLTDTDGGVPNLHRGDRKLIVWEDDEVVFHGRIWIVERTGDSGGNFVRITAFDPWFELGFESDDNAGRPVRDVDGNFITPDFGAIPVSGPQLVLDALTNSVVGPADEHPGPGGEGPLPINFDSDNFSVDLPPNVDLNPTGIMAWPQMMGDFFTDLVNTGVVDIRMRPVDPSEGFDPYVMVDIECGPDLGTDRSEDVHFDYWTGAHNATECRHVEDFSSINNKLYDLLGPPADAMGERFQAGNITPSIADAIVAGLGDRITASRERYGVFMQIRIIDTTDEDPEAAGNRPLFEYAWSAEQGYRVEPRDMLFITPAPGTGALYDAPSDFDAGDQITVNVGSDFGLPLAATQRVYGYDKTWSRERVVTLGQLLTSADPA